ncbi:MAG: killer suppression protein [Proteobacteria bacterium]|nr:killer suppression protein [Pseudomonadota bacterium]
MGPEQAKLIMRRLIELGAAENLEDLRKLPQMRAHELIQDRAGQISLDIKNPYRLIVVPDYEKEDMPRKKDGGLDWQRITKVKVLEIADTHD